MRDAHHRQAQNVSKWVCVSAHGCFASWRISVFERAARRVHQWGGGGLGFILETRPRMIRAFVGHFFRVSVPYLRFVLLCVKTSVRKFNGCDSTSARPPPPPYSWNRFNQKSIFLELVDSAARACCLCACLHGWVTAAIWAKDWAERARHAPFVFGFFFFIMLVVRVCSARCLGRFCSFALCVFFLPSVSAIASASGFFDSVFFSGGGGGRWGAAG